MIESSDDAAAVKRQLQHHRYSRYPYLDVESGEVWACCTSRTLPLKSRDRTRRAPAKEPVARRRVREMRRSAICCGSSASAYLALVIDREERVIGLVTMECAEAVFGETR